LCGLIIVIFLVGIGLWPRVAFNIRILLRLRVEILLRLLAEVLI
jgi:hypothetical protein